MPSLAHAVKVAGLSDHSSDHSDNQRRLTISVLAALCLLLLFPARSEAHAILLRSDPARDAVLAHSPEQVRMWFSEDLNPSFSTAYVVNAKDSAASITSNTDTHVDR